AFLPLGFWPGIMGKFMIFFPLTLSTVLFSSLFIALVMNSMLTSAFMKTEEGELKKADLIKISLALLIFGILLIVSGVTETHVIFQVLGALGTIFALVWCFMGLRNRAKAHLVKRGRGLLAFGFLFFILGFVGSPK